MTKPRKWIFGLATVLTAAVGVVVVAQDFWDDESLFAQEELTMDQAETGTLPVAESTADDDLFGALFGEDAATPEEPVFEEPLGDLSPVEAVAEDDLLGAFESVDAVTEVPDVFEATPEGADAAQDDLFADFDTDTSFGAAEVVDDMLTAGDQDTASAVDATMDEAGLGDVFEGDLDAGGLSAGADADADVDFDSLFDDFTDSEPAAVAEPAPAPEAVPVVEDDLFAGFDDEPAAVAEPAPAQEAAPAVEDDLFAGFDDAVVEPEPVPEKGLEQEQADTGTFNDDDVDFDALLSEFSGEFPLADPPPPVATPSGTQQPREPVAGATPMPSDVPVAQPSVYRDELALDDDLFAELAEETRRAAAEPPPVVMQPTVSTVTVVDEDAGSRAVRQPARQPRVPVPSPTPAPAARRRPVVSRERSATEPAPEGTLAFEEAERLRRVARESHALSSLDTAAKAMKERDYRSAIQMYEEALRVLPRRPDLEPARSRARSGLASAYFRQSAVMIEMGNLEEALSAAQGAARHGHRRGPDAVRRIRERLERPEEADPAEGMGTQPRWEQDDFKKIDREIEEWLRRGREAYLTGEYERSILAFESVLARDPENKEAIRMMRAAADRQFDRSSMEFDVTRQRMISDVRKTWNPRQYGLHEEPINPDEGMQTATSDDEDQVQSILDKMEQIRIPEVSFRQANIRDVLMELQKLSVEFDPAPAREDRTGVNIILQLDTGNRTAEPSNARRAPAQPDFFGMPAEGGASGGTADGVLVTFTALDISLKDALETVIGAADLKYRVRGNIVLVVPSDAADGEIVHRMYDVLPSAIARLQDLSSAVTSTSGNQPRRGGTGDFLAMEGGGDLGGGADVDLRTFFQEMGVQWPARSSIKFVRGLGKLVVANTQENLAVFESVLSILNVVPYQIEIEARFVEVAQSDVDSLGLEWLLTDNWEIAEMKADANLPPNARRRIMMNANDSSGGFTSGNRFLSQGGTGSLLGDGIMDNVATVSSVLTNPELSMVLHALQQRGHTDLLSAPKITTQSGQQATIKVVTEYIYPTSFETEGISGDSGEDNVAGGTVGAVVTPLDFQTREVGVILEVLPEVSPEGQMINLLLSPEVVSEPTWRNFGSTYISYDPNGNPVEQQLNMEQPFFHTRKLRTNLLIYNGATVVMGGMITEVRNSVDDSVPFLGDIPVLGRLFRSKYDASEKRNLLIFVTARLVDPAGRPLDRERLGVDQGIAERIVGIDN